MRYEVDPGQQRLFDPYAPVFSEVAYRHLRDSFYAVFRHVILELMPVQELREKFDATLGRPTKELYSVAGLILIMEFKNWTIPEAVHAYMFDCAVQYALNLPPAKQSFSHATLERYQRLFRENALAQKTFDGVTLKLVEELELNVSRQRLDSTHVQSNMALFGRTRLLAVTIERFLKDLVRHDSVAYEALPDELRVRYEGKRGWQSRTVDQKQGSRTREQRALDLRFLIERFADSRHKNRPTYQMMVQVFEEQCEVCEGRVVVKAKTGGDVIQNPSDPDATCDGHKGKGYQIQSSESCSEDNEVQLILAAKVETAVQSDQEAVEPVIQRLQAKALQPDTLIADTNYGRDANTVAAAAEGIDLQSPVCGKSYTNRSPYQLSVDDFVLDEVTNTVVRCPAGHSPESSEFHRERDVVETFMPYEACAGCEFGAECPIKRYAGKFRLSFTMKRHRIEGRRREQATEAFIANYAIRSGAEATFSGIKTVSGMRRLRIRGLKSVSSSLLLKYAGWNVLRASMSSKMRERMQAIFAAGTDSAARSAAESLLSAAVCHLRRLARLAHGRVSRFGDAIPSTDERARPGRRPRGRVTSAA